MAAERKTRAREYLRVSLDLSGRERSVEEQHAENRRVAEREGWTLGEPYRDVGSASRYSRKTRGGYDRLVADLSGGRFDAETLVLWEPSRGSRRVSEWVRLIELCEERGVAIHVTTHSHTYDPGSIRDRRSLLEDSVDSEYESGKLSMRGKRAAAANAEAGRWHGKVTYGFRRRRDPETGKTVAQEVEPAEAEVVRELYARLQAGHTLNAIAVDFADRGVTTRSGRAWRPEHLRDLAMRPAYAGIRVHNGSEYPGAWPAVVDTATFHAVRTRLADATRRTPRPGRGRHLLSQIARCAECGGRLTARLNEGKPKYHCHDRGCVTIAKAELDELGEKVMLGYLARDDVFAALAAGSSDETALQAVRDELATLRSRLDELATAAADGTMSVTLAAKAEEKINTRMRELTRREAELATPPALSGLLAPGEDVAARWGEAPLSARREVARLLLSPGYLGELRVRSVGRGGHTVPAAERVEWVRE